MNVHYQGYNLKLGQTRICNMFVSGIGNTDVLVTDHFSRVSAVNLDTGKPIILTKIQEDELSIDMYSKGYYPSDDYEQRVSIDDMICSNYECCSNTVLPPPTRIYDDGNTRWRTLEDDYYLHLVDSTRDYLSHIKRPVVKTRCRILRSEAHVAECRYETAKGKPLIPSKTRPGEWVFRSLKDGKLKFYYGTLYLARVVKH